MPSPAPDSRPLNATAASLLGLLHDGPMSGWDLLTVAQDRIGGFWTLTQSQVYRELTTLDRLGLIEKGEVGARERTPYRITDAGREAFGHWIASDPGSETIRVPLLLTLAFADHLDPARIGEIVATSRAIHEQRLTQYLAETADVTTPGARATLDFGIGYERAALAWFDRLPELLEIPGSPCETSVPDL